MNKYELVYIIAPDVDEEGRKALRERVNDLIVRDGGEVIKVEDWGKRRLAYDIKKESEGFYVLFYVTCEPACVAEVDRVMKITDEILKHMIVRSDEKGAANE